VKKSKTAKEVRAILVAKPKKVEDDPVYVEVVSGVEGASLYLDGYRLAGPKPWGGGAVLYRFEVRDDKDAKILRGAVKKILRER
jgi:hypothetical protein